MIKDKLPDGFPVEQTEEPMNDYPCDNCGKRFNANKDAIQASGRAKAGEPYHVYDFCCEDCAYEFAKDNGLILHNTDSNTDDYDLTLAQDGEEPGYASATDEPTTDDPVAAAVKSINVGGVSTDGANDSANEEATEELEPVPEELVQATLAAEAERQETGLHERKVLQVWDRVVSNAQEIAQLASEIEEKNNELKALKKDYETLVKRQNTYILQNGDGIQTTFADLDSPADPQPETDVKPDAEAETSDSDAEAVDSLAWRDEPVTTLTNYGLTEKQADKAQEAFGTLGRLQDWLCADYRDKQPGIGQALQDKLTDALNKYTDGFYNALKNRADYNAEADADAEAETDK